MAAGVIVEALEERTFFSAGQLDPTFGHGGVIKLEPAMGRSAEEWLGETEVLPNGGLVATTQIWRNAADIRRYTPGMRLDSSFGRRGFVHIDYTDPDYYRGWSLGTAVQSDGSILHMFHQSPYSSYPTYHAAAKIERYLSNGQVDQSFGDNGIVTLWRSEDSPEEWPSCFLAQPDGSIVVGGQPEEFYRPRPKPRIMLKRLLPDGTLDASFGSNGLAELDFPKRSFVSVDKLIRQPDGKIICLGSDRRYKPTTLAYDSASKVILARFNADGSVDSSFGEGGVATAFILPSHKPRGNLNDAVLQPDGGIVVSAVADDAYAMTMRFNPDGTLDQKYGRGGRSILQRSRDFGEGDYVPLASDSHGGVLFTLTTTERTGLIGRLNSGGRIDKKFGRHGSSVANYENPTDVFVQADGRILVIGVSASMGGNIVVARLQGGPHSLHAYASTIAGAIISW